MMRRAEVMKVFGACLALALVAVAATGCTAEPPMVDDDPVVPTEEIGEAIRGYQDGFTVILEPEFDFDGQVLVRNEYWELVGTVGVKKAIQQQGDIFLHPCTWGEVDEYFLANKASTSEEGVTSIDCFYYDGNRNLVRIPKLYRYVNGAITWLETGFDPSGSALIEYTPEFPNE